jgi:hypothetical protein
LFIKEYFAKNWILTFIFLVIIGTSLFNLTWEKYFGFSYIIFRLVIIGWGLVLLPQFFPGKKLNKFGEVTSYGWFVLFALMNIWATLLYNEQ